MLTVNIMFEYCTIKLCVPRSRGRSGSRSGRSGWRWIGIPSSAPTKKMSKTGVKNIMFEFVESKMCFIKNSVRWNDHDQILINLVECDVRIRHRQFEGHRRFERRIVFLSRAGVKAPILKGLVGCFSGDTT